MGLPSGAPKRQAVRDMFDRIAPRYDLVNRIMTLRMDVAWRRRTVRELALAPGSVVADLACGTGDLCREIAAHGYRPIGFDLSIGMLKAAPEQLRRAGRLKALLALRPGGAAPAPEHPERAPLVNADVLELPLADGSLDGATCGFALRNLTSIPALLTELARTVRPGGRICLLEVDTPRNPLLRLGHRLYFGRVVPLIGATLSDGAAYRYLPRSVAYLPPTGELLDSLRAAGFTDARHHRLSAGIAQLLVATRRTT